MRHGPECFLLPPLRGIERFNEDCNASIDGTSVIRDPILVDMHIAKHHRGGVIGFVDGSSVRVEGVDWGLPQDSPNNHIPLGLGEAVPKEHPNISFLEGKGDKKGLLRLGRRVNRAWGSSLV